MVTITPKMNKAELVKILADDFGVEAKTKATVQELLDLLKENGAAVSEALVAKKDANAKDKDKDKGKDKDKDKAKEYIINIFKDKGDNSPVVGCVNGEVFRIVRGKDVKVSGAIHDCLTNGAKQMVAETNKDNVVTGTTLVPTYPMSSKEV